MKVLTLLLLFLPLLAESQQLKTYSGEYHLEEKSNFNDNGNAVYTFYENGSSERIKDGTFSFQGKTTKIEGQFKDGLRIGLWKISYALTSKYSINPCTIIVTAFYKAGKLNGKCTYVKTAYPSKKILESSFANFKENVMVGDYSYVKYPSLETDKQVTIKYAQDSSGKLNGEYIAEFYQECCDNLGQIEDIVRFENGNMTYRLCREKINGKVYYKYENGSYSKSIVNYGPKEVFSSTWDAHIGVDFWVGGDCQYCGTQFNPLYAFIDGIDLTGFTFFSDRADLK